MFKDGVPLASLMGIAGLLEIVGGLLVVIGLFTRPVAFVLSGMMAVAYFMFHAPAEFLPDPQWRRIGNHVLLRLPVPRRSRRWPVERRCQARLIDCHPDTSKGREFPALFHSRSLRSFDQ